MCAVFGLVEGRQVLAGNPCQHPGQGLEQGDLAAKLGQDCRRFQTNVAAADNNDVANAAVDFAHQLVTVGTRPDRMQAG